MQQLRADRHAAETHFVAGGRWDDVVWRFPITTAGAPQALFSINWSIPLGNEEHLTDPAHAVALESWRRVLWTMIINPPDGHPRKGSFCGRFSTGLRLLAPWMVETCRRDLGHLDRATFTEYLEVLSTKVRQDYDEDEQSLVGEDGITDAALATYIVIFDHAYVVRHELANVGLPFPPEDPLNSKSALVVAGEMCKKVKRQTPEVPDDVFVRTINRAMATCDATWLEPLIALAGVLSSASSHDEVDRLCLSFRERHPDVSALDDNASRAVRKAVNGVRAACQVLLQSSAGLRLSELCGITTDKISSSTGLPDCVTVEPTFDDEYELFMLRASIFKDVASSEPASWVIGMRPTGSAYLPPPVRAIDLLHRLDDGWRRSAGIDGLLIMFSNSKRIPHESRHINAVKADKVRDRQRQWMVDTGCITEGERVTTHMWRKTFARYLIRVSADLLPAISHHLKHLSIAMTENGYCRPHPATRQLIADARVEEAGTLILGTILGTKRLEGPVAAEIKAFGAELGRRLGNRPAEGLSRDVETEVRERRVELYGNDVGFCVFRGESARCHALSTEPIAPFLRLAPSFAERRPEVCQRCANFGIGGEHLPFWLARRADLQERIGACGSKCPPALVAYLIPTVITSDTLPIPGW